MLIITREIGEILHIGTQVQVEILGFHGREIRLGITGPKGILIDRDEVRQRRLAEGTIQTQEPT